MSRYRLLAFLIDRAARSNFWLRMLNLLMTRTIPFNRPHRFRIQELEEEKIRIFTPYRRSNYNHIKGIHACAIATAAEFSAGFLLLTKLDPTRYRFIMANLTADYHYQAKTDIVAEAQLSMQQLKDELLRPLEESEAATVIMQSVVYDTEGNRVAVVNTTWQVKRWDSVRTRV